MGKDNRTGKETSKTNDEEIGKSVAYFQALLSSWLENRMEKDKQILTLSALAIGFLMTFRASLEDIFSFSIWILANMSFIASLILILIIFQQNSDYIGKIIQREDQKFIDHLEKLLHQKTLWALILFIVGIILTVLLAIYGAGFTIMKGI